jgi:hypothetical protein
MTAIAEPPQTFSSVDRVEVGSYRCPPAAYPTATSSTDCSPLDIAQAWIADFNSIVISGDLLKLSDIFTEKSYWRDQLCLSWDFHTFHGVEKLIEFLKTNGSELKIQSFLIDVSAPHRLPVIAAIDYKGKVPCVQFWVDIETKFGRGVGIGKLVQDASDGNRWKAFTLFSTLREIRGHEESVGHRRVNGANHGSLVARSNWQDRRIASQEFSSQDPVVLIVGTYTSTRDLNNK